MTLSVRHATSCRGLGVKNRRRYQIPVLDDRLIERRSLRSFLTCDARLLTITAPGGFGKTIALAEWARHHNAAWCPLRPDSFSALGLANCVSAAFFERYGSTAGSQTPTASDLAGLDGPALARLIIEALQSQDNCALAIDEIQYVPEASPAHAFLEELIELALISGMRLGLCGRSLSQLKGLSKHKIVYETTEVTATQLGFSRDETELAARTVFGLVGCPADYDALFLRTEGWPALVTLAGRWLLHQSSKNWGIALDELKGNETSIYDYLASQILDFQPELHRQFLLMSALIEEIPADLAEQLLPGSGTSIMNDLLAGRFVTNHASQGSVVLTHHPLLREFLQERSFQELGTVTVQRIRDLAACWFAERGQFHDAFGLWFLAGKIEQIVLVLERWEIEFKEWWSEFSPWLERIPKEALAGSVRLQLRLAMNSANLGHGHEATEWLDRAERSARDTPDADSNLDVECVRAVVLFFGNFAADALAQCQKLEPRLDQMTPFQRGTLATALVLLHNNDFIDPKAALRYLDIYEDTINRAGYKRGRFVAAANRAVASRIVGDFEGQLGVREKLEKSLGGKPIPIYFEALLFFSEAHALIEIADSGADQAMISAVAKLRSIGAEGQAQFGENLLAFHFAEHQKLATVTLPDSTANHPYRDEAGLYGRLALAWEALWTDRPAQAIQCIEELLSIHTGPGLDPIAKLESARLYMRIGLPAKSAELAKAVLASAETLSMRSIRFRAGVVLASAEPGFHFELIESLMADLNRPHYAELLVQRERANAPKFLGQALDFGIDPDLALNLLARLGDSVIRVSFFGGLTVWVDGREVSHDDWVRPQAKALFAFLLLQRGPVHAEVVIDAFWPDADVKSGRANLKTTVGRIRKAIGHESAVSHENDLYKVGFASSVWKDVDAFLGIAQLIEREESAGSQKVNNHFGRALRIASGGFLPEYRYEDWAAIERERIESMVQRIQSLQGEALLRERRFEDVIEIAEPIIAADHLSEAGYSLLIRALVGLGRSEEASVRIRKFASRLNRELGVDLSEAMQGLSSELGLK